MSSYGWTIAQVDDLTMPQLWALLQQIKDYPPMNVLMTEFFNGMSKKRAHTRDQQIESVLTKMGPHVETAGADDSAPRGKPMFTKTGSRLVRLEVKKTGKRIV